MDARGETGAGTLILFIALLIVAATAAAVLIQTTSAVQQKALVTGTQTTGIISSGIQVMSIEGTDGSANMHNLTFMLRLNAGSESLHFDTTLIQVHTQNMTTTYTFDTVFTVNVSAESGTYNLTYVSQGLNHQPDILVRGDLVELYLQLPRDMIRGETMSIRFIPQGGLPTIVSFTFPDIMTNKHIHLYP